MLTKKIKFSRQKHFTVKYLFEIFLAIFCAKIQTSTFLNYLQNFHKNSISTLRQLFFGDKLTFLRHFGWRINAFCLSSSGCSSVALLFLRPKVPCNFSWLLYLEHQPETLSLCNVMRCSSFLSPFEDGAPEMSVTFILGYARGFKFEAEAALNRKWLSESLR